MTGINITLVRFALEQGYDFLNISQGGVAIPLTGTAELYVPFTLGPGDVTVEFTSDSRGLHSSHFACLQLSLSRC
jgi:hypothetical protein